MNVRSTLVVGLLLILAVGGIALQGLGHSAQAAMPAKERPALAVDVAPVRAQSVPLVWHAMGQVEPWHSVTVRPQVTGMLQEVAFKEGDLVQQGQVLFRIDPAPFQAQLQQAQAQLAKDQATLANAQWQAQRQKQLLGRNYSSSLDYENAKSRVDELQATIALDQAQLTQAQIQLGYTSIRSPIEGYAGSLGVKAGNLVESGGNTALVTINQITPTLVRFAVPQSELAGVRHYQQQPEGIQVQLSQAPGAEPGSLVFIDNQVDSNTGSIFLKAKFANTDKRLWPGQFVDLDMVLTVEPNVLVVPETAIQPGQNGSYVYVLDAGKVRVQPVQIARQYRNLVVIGSGLNAGELVVTHAPRSIRDGMSAQPLPQPEATPAEPAQAKVSAP